MVAAGARVVSMGRLAHATCSRCRAGLACQSRRTVVMGSVRPDAARAELEDQFYRAQADPPTLALN